MNSWPTSADLSRLANQVRQNCDISDARFAGSFSICGLALRLRDLYKWERHLDPWVEHPSGEVLAWIGTKETHWEKLTEEPFVQLEVNGSRWEPFDIDSINATLAGHNLFYGAGYARALKPTFFLAPIEETRQIDGIPVYRLGREKARDMLTLPALTQNSEILVRQEAALQYLWDQIFYIRKSGRPALAAALTHCGIDDHQPAGIKPHLDRLLRIQMPTFIRHELGEIRSTTLDRNLWRRIVSSFAGTPIELFARTLKDLLADTHPLGPLPHIIEQHRQAALSFYLAFQDDFAARVFPGLKHAYGNFQSNGCWADLGNCVERGRETMGRMANRLEELFLANGAQDNLSAIQMTIQQELIDPLLRN